MKIKTNYSPILFYLLVMVVVVVFAGILFDSEISSELFTVEILNNGTYETISCLSVSENNCYVFLPSYAELSDCVIRLCTGSDISIGGIRLHDGMSCSSFEWNTPYELTSRRRGSQRTYSISFLHSAHVAAMYIDTETGSMKNIHSKKGKKENGKIRLYGTDGSLVHTGVLESINGRGNSTWNNYDKKPYSLTLINEADLLCMGKAQRWVLLANASDPSNMRNKMAYDFANAVGLLYSPDSEWVDLYLNGDYAGLYLLCERNEVHPERINISPQIGAVLSREFESILKIQNINYFSTELGEDWRIHYPLQNSTDVYEQLEKRMQALEDCLVLAAEGNDSADAKLDELIDVESWVRKYLIEEVMGNADAACRSSYLFFDSIEEDGKCFAGPVWDYDLILGNEAYPENADFNAMYANRLHVSNAETTFLFSSLYKIPSFYDKMAETYEKVFVPQLLELINSRMDEYSRVIASAAEMDRIRWNARTDMLSEVKYMKNFLRKRMDFLSSLWLEGKVYHSIRGDSGNGYMYIYRFVASGDCLTALPKCSDRYNQTFMGWYYADTGEPFNSTIPIYENIELVAKWADASNQIKQAVKLAPLACIGLLGCYLLLSDVRRMKKGR